MQTINETYDVVVCGGGLAGVSAAIASARHGQATCLVQDRPVLGGNSSSEIRVTPHGSATWHAYARETGIISEPLVHERTINHKGISEDGWTNSIWDMTLYDMVVRTRNLTMYESTTVEDVELDGSRISAVVARTAEAETLLHITGRQFIDCTGDGVVGDLAGNRSMWGAEARSEYDEPHAPMVANRKAVMGNTLCFEAVDTGRPVSYTAPEWAVKYTDPSFFSEHGRPFHHLKEWKSGYWWIELAAPLDPVHDNERLRHELTRHVLGVWNYIKNVDPELKKEAENFALDWVGQVPGKRESRRLLGKYLLTEHDLINRTVFPDEVAFGGWFVDAHTPGGLLADSSEPLNMEGMNPNSEYGVKTFVGPYGIPLRSLIAADVPNLLMAGRDISATHVALASTRVMATCATLGQAAGTAAAAAIAHGIDPAEADTRYIDEIQQNLLRDGCFLPNYRNQDNDDLARRAHVSASSRELLRGSGPSTPSRLAGLDQWRDAPVLPENGVLERRCGQLIATGPHPHLDSVDICLTNSSDSETQIHAELNVVDDIWDYRVAPSEPLASLDVPVPAGGPMWVHLDLADVADSALPVNGYVRLDVASNPAIEWHVSPDVQPGCVALYEARPGRLRRFAGGSTLSFRVEPPQDCYRPENVLTGVTRPAGTTNLWRSDPNEPLPQWIQLEWDEPTIIHQIQLTFEGALLREYHAAPPFYRDPQILADYELQAWNGTSWDSVVTVRGNSQPRVVHEFSANVTTRKLRLLAQSSNGDSSAGVFEIRCYADTKCTPVAFQPTSTQL